MRLADYFIIDITSLLLDLRTMGPQERNRNIEDILYEYVYMFGFDDKFANLVKIIYNIDTKNTSLVGYDQFVDAIVASAQQLDVENVEVIDIVKNLNNTMVAFLEAIETRGRGDHEPI